MTLTAALSSELADSPCSVADCLEFAQAMGSATVRVVAEVAVPPDFATVTFGLPLCIDHAHLVAIAEESRTGRDHCLPRLQSVRHFDRSCLADAHAHGGAAAQHQSGYCNLRARRAELSWGAGYLARRKICLDPVQAGQHFAR